VLLIGALYAWRGDTFDLNLSPRAIAHLSILLGAFAITLAAWTWLGRYDLLYAHNSSIVWGAAYTDVNARLPLYSFQAGAGIVLAGALIANVWLRRLWVPIAAAILWIGMLLIGQIYPAVVQGFFVTPSAQSYELPYITREIAGTRAAYGLSNVTESQFTGDQPLTLKDVQSDQVTVNNLRLWDYTPLQLVYEQLQTIRTYYSFNDIDIDRYNIGGQYQQVEISARELDTSKLPPAAQNWVNQHLQYTHGYGLAASPVNAVNAEGLPDYVVKDVSLADWGRKESASFFYQVGLQLRGAAIPKAREVRVPALVIQADGDLSIIPAASRKAFDALGSKDKTWKTYPGYAHDSEFEADRTALDADITQWVKARSA